jgi:hypothetical protein
LRLNDALMVSMMGRLHDESGQRKRDGVDGLYDLSQQVESTQL